MKISLLVSHLIALSVCSLKVVENIKISVPMWENRTENNYCEEFTFKYFTCV